MAGIYKAYDIRGIYPDQLDEAIIHGIGKAYADILREELNKDPITLVVGSDARLSSPQLTRSLIAGIRSQGVHVVQIGLASTPTFYFAVARYGYDGGMQVSASHNPKEYNGVKIVRAKAYPVGYDTGIGEIERRVQGNQYRESTGTGGLTEKAGVLDEELRVSLTYGEVEKIKPLKVVADVANSMGAPILEKLFGALPCELVRMNFELDGSFPVHQADPFQEKNIADLKQRVVQEQADLGIATDGDGDRVFFIDETGELVEPAILRGLLAKIVLREHPGATICYDIRPGKITRDMIVEYGGRPVVTRVGHSLIKAHAIAEEAVFAGESSGHFFLDIGYGFFEVPMIVTLKILQEISEENRPFSQIIHPLKRYYHSGEINSEVEDKDAKMAELAEIFGDAKHISWLDGVTIEYDDFWFNVRPSNTEPLLRLNLETRTKEIMERKRDEVLRLIRQ
jgi:phosphomannomutase